VTLRPFFALANRLAGLEFAVAALADSGNILAVNESILLHPSDRHLDDPVVVFTDDRFLGDNVGDVVADRLTHFLAMAQTVAGAAVTALAGRWMVGAENRFHVSDVTYHDDEAAMVMLVFPQIVRRILENHIDAAMAVTAVEKVLHHRVVFLRLLLVTHPRLGDDPAQVSN
jgi:predicted dehydrogenase